MQVPLRPAWLALAEHARSIKHRHLRELFSQFLGISLILEGAELDIHRTSRCRRRRLIRRSDGRDLYWRLSLRGCR